MTRDDVLRMAREAKFPVNHPDWADAAVRFAALVSAEANAARIAAQTENEALKDKLAASGVSDRRAVREAVLAEREACAHAAEGFEENRDWVPGSLWGNLRAEVAAAIRARGTT